MENTIKQNANMNQQVDETSIKNQPTSRSGRLFRPFEVIYMLGMDEYRIAGGCVSRSGWASWGVLEAFGTVLDRKRWPTWFQVVSTNGSKIRFGASCGRLGNLLQISCARFSIKMALNSHATRPRRGHLRSWRPNG